MKLGIIGAPNKESFRNAAQNGLEFVEFCINGGHDTDAFFKQLDEIRSWMHEYEVGVGSIGRWKAVILDEAGNLVPEELEIAYGLIDMAAELGCRNYVCGMNEVLSLSYFEHISRAIEYFSQLIEYGKKKGVQISAYNCRKMNFVHNPEVWKLIHGHLKDLGIKYDPSHAIYNGGDYLKEALEWGHRFNHVHLKGSMVVNGQRVDDPPAGLDQTDWKSFLNILRAKGYDQGLSIEPHSAVWKGELGQKGLEYTIGYMKDLLFRQEERMVGRESAWQRNSDMHA